MSRLAFSLERFASLRAEIDGGAPREEVLRREGLSDEQWLAGQRDWLALMASEAQRGRLGPCQRYQAIYGEQAPGLVGVVEAPEEEAPAEVAQVVDPPSIDETGVALELDLGEILPFGEGQDAAVIEPSVEEEEPHEAVGATGFITSLNLDDSTPFSPQLPEEPAAHARSVVAHPPVAPPPSSVAHPPVAPPPSSVAQPQVVPPPSSVAQPPVAPPASSVVQPPVAPAPPPVMPPPAPTAPPARPGTGMMAALPDGPSVPFAGQAAAPASAADEVAAEAEDLIGGTAFVGALTDADLADVLPFEGDDPPLPGAAPGGDLDGTAYGVAALTGDALPFADGPAAPPPAPDIAPASAPAVGATAFVGALTDEQLGEALPFEASSPPAAPVELTVEQYASLCVELRRGGGVPVLQRYGIASGDDQQRLDAHWRHRFEVEPALAGRFQQASEAYEAWLNQQ